MLWSSHKLLLSHFHSSFISYLMGSVFCLLLVLVHHCGDACSHYHSVYILESSGSRRLLGNCELVLFKTDLYYTVLNCCFIQYQNLKLFKTHP